MSVEESLSGRLPRSSAKHISVIRKQPWTKLPGTAQCEHSTRSCLGPLARAPSQRARHLQRAMARLRCPRVPGLHSAALGLHRATAHLRVSTECQGALWVHTGMSGGRAVEWMESLPPWWDRQFSKYSWNSYSLTHFLFHFRSSKIDLN